MKRTIKFGIFGLGRGSSFYQSILANNGEVVAVGTHQELLKTCPAYQTMAELQKLEAEKD